MKKLAMASFLSLLFIGVSLFSLAGVVVPASAAGIPLVHGHNGQVEYWTTVTSLRQHLGWGLDFDQQSGTANWIHYSISTEVNSNTRYLGIKFETGSVDAWISAIHVYNGHTKIYESPPLSLSGATYRDNWLIIDLGSDHLIDTGLGLSIQVSAGVAASSHNFKIYAVAAEWH